MTTGAPNETHSSTPVRLLATLREVLARPDLGYLRAPTPLPGGFDAELLRFRLAGAPAGLDHELVARIVRRPEVGAWESTIQRTVAEQGFATPAVRLTAPATGPLGRWTTVMDHVDGRPTMQGLGLRSIAGQVPTLLRHLPDQLAQVAATLHALDPAPLAERLAGLEHPLPSTSADYVRRHGDVARTLRRDDLAAVADRLLSAQPSSSACVTAHGDLHPLNLLITDDGPVLLDWTVARVTHPGFTVGFTHLMLTNPPVALPGPGPAILRPVGRSIGRRFLTTYRRLTDGTPAEVDDRHLEWFRKVHALRVLVELAELEAAGDRPTAGHPWLVLEPVVERMLGVVPRR